MRNITWAENWATATAAMLNTPCWECNSHALDKSCGYPKIHRYGVNVSVSRHIFQVLFGDLPREIHVRHKCDNTRCINPEHLLSGTAKDNVRDCVERGRRRDQRGAKNNMATLSTEDVLKIRKDMRTHVQIAKDYDVKRECITSIKNRKTWAWL